MARPILHEYRRDRFGWIFGYIHSCPPGFNVFRRVMRPTDEHNRLARSIGNTEVFYDLGEGLFVITHYSVEQVRCPQCDAAAGELCRGPSGATRAVHYLRKDAAREQRL